MANTPQETNCTAYFSLQLPILFQNSEGHSFNCQFPDRFKISYFKYFFVM